MNLERLTPGRTGCFSIWIVLAANSFRLESLDFGIGKAWISLDSLARSEGYQRVTRDFRRKDFRVALRPDHGLQPARGSQDYAERRKRSRRKCSINSDFLQSIEARPSATTLRRQAERLAFCGSWRSQDRRGRPRATPTSKALEQGRRLSFR
jgi:hypothetical protein